MEFRKQMFQAMNHQVYRSSCRVFILIPVLFLLLAIGTRAQEINDRRVELSDSTPKPVLNNGNFNNDPDDFQFVIVSDRTGGMQPGIFASAMGKVNLMQPEFVISVGDLIDGYTRDPKVWERQWAEFNGLVRELEMPFYYVPGNHDISNEEMQQDWNERLGPSYYYFIYKNVLFICLNTEDRIGGGITNRQVKYVENVLEANRNVRWTLLFMHRPLWSYGNMGGYEGIEKALAGRDYTLFSGHHHHYRIKRQNGARHFILGTTGGGSYLRGPEVGEFHHITWVTMKDDGPRVAHLQLSGILGEDVVPEEDYAMVQALRMGNWMSLKPIVHHKPNFQTVQTEITLTNPVNRSMEVFGRLKSSGNISFRPDSIQTTIEPGGESVVSLEILSNNEASIEKLNNQPIPIELTAAYEREQKKRLSLPASKSLVLDWKHQLKKITNQVTVDGDLSEWERGEMISITRPQFADEGWAWRGPDDATYRFAVRHSGEKIYLALVARDNKLLFERDQLKEKQDKFFVWVDGRPERARKRANFHPDSVSLIELAVGEEVQNPHVKVEGIEIQHLEAALKSTENGQQLELAIPTSFLKILQRNGEKWNSFRLNVGMMDHDRPENTKPAVLWGRPRWDSPQDFEGAATWYK